MMDDGHDVSPQLSPSMSVNHSTPLLLQQARPPHQMSDSYRQQQPLLPPISNINHHRSLPSQASSAQYSTSPVPPNMQQPQQHPPPPPHHHPSNMPPPYPHTNYQAYPNGAVPSTTGHNGLMRYPIPPSQPTLDSRHIQGGRHKKEIKRRTKTGCLTCRKRRIKCDEGQPTCRNCSKSKRECLGYDPIFKQQHAPANIKPAPTHTHPSGANPADPAHSYRAPHAFPGAGGGFATGPGAGQQTAAEPHFEYNASLDPALAGGDHSHAMTQNSYAPALQPQRKVNPVAIEDLFSLNDIPPRYQLREAPPPISAAAQQEIETFYKYHYAAGLDHFFETNWYSARGLDHLQHDPQLQDFVAQCVDQFKARADDATSKAITSIEARLVWQLSCMPRTVVTTANGAVQDPTIQELLPRIDTIEHLLTGQFLPADQVPSPPQAPPPPTQSDHDTSVGAKYNEHSFWYHVTRFVSLHDDLNDPAARREINASFDAMRGILSLVESRDVIYSLAIVRHIGGRMAEFHPQRHLVASTNDPNHDVNKLKIAHQFVEREDQHGSTQVIQRMCSMAIRGWILQKQ